MLDNDNHNRPTKIYADKLYSLTGYRIDESDPLVMMMVDYDNRHQDLMIHCEHLQTQLTAITRLVCILLGCVIGILLVVVALFVRGVIVTG